MVITGLDVVWSLRTLTLVMPYLTGLLYFRLCLTAWLYHDLSEVSFRVRSGMFLQGLPACGSRTHFQQTQQPVVSVISSCTVYADICNTHMCEIFGGDDGSRTRVQKQYLNWRLHLSHIFGILDRSKLIWRSWQLLKHVTVSSDRLYLSFIDSPTLHSLL